MSSVCLSVCACLTLVQQVVSKVNDSKRQFEIMQRVARYKRRLVNAHYIDLNAPGRQYVRDGTLRMIGASKQKDVYVRSMLASAVVLTSIQHCVIVLGHAYRVSPREDGRRAV